MDNTLTQILLLGDLHLPFVEFINHTLCVCESALTVSLIKGHKSHSAVRAIPERPSTLVQFRWSRNLGGEGRRIGRSRVYLADPVTVHVTSAQSETVHVASANPETVHVTSPDPETVHVTSAQSETVHVTSAQSETVHVPSTEPENLSEPVLSFPVPELVSSVPVPEPEPGYVPEPEHVSVSVFVPVAVTVLDLNWNEESFTHQFWSGMDNTLTQILLLGDLHLPFVKFIDRTLCVCESALTVIKGHESHSAVRAIPERPSTLVQVVPVPVIPVPVVLKRRRRRKTHWPIQSIFS
ncbi:hypothetical protein F2P79_022180 [Pimephales promelas]|nr:hypothetical protein F2P79_022180 [Pimephales promelas]